MSNRETSEDIASLAARVLNEEPRPGDENLAFNALLVQAKKLAGSALSQREAEPQAGTHAYELIAAAEKQNVQVTETLIQMIAATVLAKLIEEEGGGRTNITFSPKDVDAMHRDYVMEAKRDGVLTTVRITPRAPEEFIFHTDPRTGKVHRHADSLAVQDEDTTGALPQAAAKAEKPYWFIRRDQDGSRTGPMSKQEAQELAEDYRGDIDGDIDGDAWVENRNCPRADCPNSDQQTSCSLCTAK